MRRTRFVATAVTFALFIGGLTAVGPVLPGTATASTPGTQPMSAAVTPGTAASAEDYTRPDLPSAQLAAKLLSHRIEVTGLETETTTTYVNPDGTLTTDSSAGPVREQVNGAWAAVNPTLVPVLGGFRPAVAKVDVVFSGGGAGPLYTVSTAAGTLSVSWPSGPLPVPTVSGNTATYSDVRPGVDLVVTSGVTGFDTAFVLKQRPTTVPIFGLLTNTSGLTPSVNADGALGFNAADGSPELFTGQAQTWDSSGKLGGGHRDRTIVSRSTFTTASRLWTISPDATFLLDPSTTYPVTIDPPVNISNAGYAFISSAYPSSSYVDNTYSEYGYNGVVNVGLAPSNLTYGTTRGYYNFDTTAIKGQTVTSATLTLSEFYSASSNCTATMVDLFDTGSLTSTTTWNNAPTTYAFLSQQASAIGGDPTYCPSGSMTFDVTGEAKGWATNSHTVNTLGVFADNEADPNSFKVFGGWYQTLSVDYTGTPSRPGGRSTSPCAGGECGANNGLV